MASMTDNQIPPALEVPSAYDQKYDRQIRLWGANGQRALQKAGVLLVNEGAGVVGVETLKNLILPGKFDFGRGADCVANGVVLTSFRYWPLRNPRQAYSLRERPRRQFLSR